MMAFYAQEGLQLYKLKPANLKRRADKRRRG
jgi:hypothetical protein